MATVAVLQGSKEATDFIESLNIEYEKVHKDFEDNFWATKMNLAGNSSEQLVTTKRQYDDFLGDKAKLEAVRSQLQEAGLSEQQRQVLQVMERTFKCYIIEQPEVKELQNRLNQLEADLQEERKDMKLGYLAAEAEGGFKEASSVQLRNIMRVSTEEGVRKAAYEGLRSIGPVVVKKLAEIVKLRNKLAKAQGYEDYYDYKVQCAEGFSKARLFEILDDLKSKTSLAMEKARQKLAAEKGETALEPWNFSYYMLGDLSKQLDPYFPFEEAVERWARSFAALGINYKGSNMTLDLCDRKGKYSNGFCHWPQPSYRRPSDGKWIPSAANFTSLASPNEVGSGRGALATLMHEGGHAAHFANIDQYSPFFSQERAPMSVSYAENQSMFLDSLVEDAAWMGRYAKTTEGVLLPWDLIEKKLRAEQPYQVFSLRAMISVCYFEKALYELPEEEVTEEKVMALADRVEKEIQGGLGPRPLLSVPHILSDESSAYYHGYVLAEMSVHQTRKYFLDKYGRIVDNEKVGQELTDVYWQPGNAAAFLDLVAKLTGKSLSADAWVATLDEDLEAAVANEKKEYEEAAAAGPKIKAGESFDLGMRVRIVHGDDVVADTEQDQGFPAACSKFKQWIQQQFPREQ